MILEAETSLLVAVRQRLIETLELDESQIEIEIDDVAPAMTGDLFYCLSPSGASPGRYTQSADNTIHDVFGVRVAVIERITAVPRDRRRNTAFLDRLRSINGRLSRVSEVLRFDYYTIGIANVDLKTQGVDNVKFHRPLVPSSIDRKPRMFTSELYGAKATTGGDTMVGMLRGIEFGGAELIGCK